VGVTTAAPKKKTTITMVTNTTIVKIKGNIDTPASLRTESLKPHP
jgi:hypothetical protein